MSFEKIPQRDGDIANRGTLRIVPSALLEIDLESWRAKLSDKQSPEEHRTVAGFFVERTAESVALGAALTTARFTRGAVVMPDWGSRVQELSASYALSRFMGALVTRDVDYEDAAGGRTGSQLNRLNKFLVDYDIDERRPEAYSVVVRRNRLDEAPFPEDGSIFRGREAWFMDAELGLYVAARTPVRVTDYMMGNLTANTGSREKALQVLDAPNSVTIAPYVSVAFLDAHNS